MERWLSFSTFRLMIFVLALGGGSVAGGVPPRWEKVTGMPVGFSGQTDGIMGDRENSYAWCMDTLGGYLYVGTSRNVFAGMLMLSGTGAPAKPEIPVPTDMRGRLYRMHLKDRTWEQHYVCPDLSGGIGPMRVGLDSGYRMMKTFKAPGKAPILYLGSVGLGLPGNPGACSLIAVDGLGGIHRVFVQRARRNLSIRAIAEHDGALFWATDDMDDNGTPADFSDDFFKGPGLWFSSDPLGDSLAGRLPYSKVEVPDWFGPDGAEILDMVSYNGWLYAFFLTFESGHAGFWCAKARREGDGWTWKLIVGDTEKGALYPKGMGRDRNGGAVPFVFQGDVYVGTMSGAAFRMMNGFGPMPPPSDPIEAMGGLGGMQIYRFDEKDRWERVMPSECIRSPFLVEILGGWINPLNLYIWRFGVVDGRLCAGTFDIGTGFDLLGWGTAEPGSLQDILIKLGLRNPRGFDLWSSSEGRGWLPISRDGFGDKWNYGVRSFASDPSTGDLYLGTANPFYGCQVWVKKAR